MNTLILHVRGSARLERFGVSCGEKLAIWYGGFGKFERMWNGDRTNESGAELSAMHKGLWVAGKVREGFGYGQMRVQLVHSVFGLEQVTGLVEDLERVAKGKRLYLCLRYLHESLNAASVLVGARDFAKPDLQRASRCVQYVYPVSDR